MAGVTFSRSQTMLLFMLIIPLEQNHNHINNCHEMNVVTSCPSWGLCMCLFLMVTVGWSF